MNPDRLERDAALHRSDPVYGKPIAHIATVSDATAGRCAEVFQGSAEEQSIDDIDPNDSEGDVFCRPKGPVDGPVPRSPMLGLAA